MPYSFHAIANEILDLAKSVNTPVTPQKLQRLMFFAQLEHVARHDEALFDDIFVFWPTGPVLPALYHKCRALEGAPLEQFLCIVSPEPGVRLTPRVPAEDLRTRCLLMEVFGRYGHLLPPALVTLARETLAPLRLEVGAALFPEHLKAAARRLASRQPTA